MKCQTCGSELKMERVEVPVYETQMKMGMADRLRYQACSNEEDAAAEVETTCETLRAEADLIDTVEAKLRACGGSEADFAEFSRWLKEALFRSQKEVKTGTETVEDPCDCPRCHGAY